MRIWKFSSTSVSRLAKLFRPRSARVLAIFSSCAYAHTPCTTTHGVCVRAAFVCLWRSCACGLCAAFVPCACGTNRNGGGIIGGGVWKTHKKKTAAKCAAARLAAACGLWRRSFVSPVACGGGGTSSARRRPVWRPVPVCGVRLLCGGVRRVAFACGLCLCVSHRRRPVASSAAFHYLCALCALCRIRNGHAVAACSLITGHPLNRNATRRRRSL